jgi:uncharacterized protein (TIGR02466 family)
MAAKILNLFPIPFYVDKIDIESDILARVEQLPYERLSQNNGWISSEKYLLNQYVFGSLHQQALAHLDVYVRNVLNVGKEVRFELENSWAMKHQAGDSAQPHAHVHSLISGIMYLKCDAQAGNFMVYRDHETVFPRVFNLPFDEKNNYTSMMWSTVPEAGDIYLFPSNLRHAVTPSESQDDRYCVAFNFFVRGHLGDRDLTKIQSLVL